MRSSIIGRGSCVLIASSLTILGCGRDKPDELSIEPHIAEASSVPTTAPADADLSASSGAADMSQVATVPPMSLVPPPRTELGLLPGAEEAVSTVEGLNATLENNNRQDGGLGTLCWARWEIARSFLEHRMSRVEALGKQVPNFDDRLEAVGAVTRAGWSSLPGEVVAFADRLQSEVNEATAIAAESDSEITPEQFESGRRLFDFERYPAVAEYVMLASQHEACTTP